MASPPEPEDKPRRRVSNHAAATEARDLMVRQLLEKERAALDAKTLKLRALRLAHETEKRNEITRQAEAFRTAMQRKAPDPSVSKDTARLKTPAKNKNTSKRSVVNSKKSPAPAKPHR